LNLLQEGPTLEVSSTWGIAFWEGLAARKRQVELHSVLERLPKRGTRLSFFDLHIDGQGVDRDVETALELLKQAAERGLADAEFKLRVCFYQGEGVERDPTRAALLYASAAA
jgi:TPR repeat protein